MAQSDNKPDPNEGDGDEALPGQSQRFGEHWLRMSAVLLAELKHRDLMDTPEAQAVIGARRQIIRKHRASTHAPSTTPRRGQRPETKWEMFLRKVGRKPRPGTDSHG